MKIVMPPTLLQWDFSEETLQQKFGNATPWNTSESWFTESGLLAELKESEGHAMAPNSAL